MKQLLVCDLDGTLLDRNNNIDPDSMAKLKQYVHSGNDFCVCTGRLDSDIKYIEKELGVQGAYRISQNGAVIRDANDHLIFSATIPSMLLPIINKIVFSPERRVEVSDINHRYFPSPRDPAHVAEFVDTSIVNSDLETFVSQPDFQAIIYLIFGTAKIFKPLEVAISNQIGTQVNVQQTSPSSLEIFSPKASKGKAVANIMKRLNLTPEQLWVAGDAENDTTMFPLTRHSFAVGSLADQPTIQAANEHTATVGEIIDQMKVLN